MGLKIKPHVDPELQGTARPDVPDPGSQAWLDGLTNVSRALGTPEFEAGLVALLNLIVPVDHCVVFTYAPDAGAGHLFTHGKMSGDQARRLAEDYVERYHAQDPHFARVSAAGGADEADRFVPLPLPTAYDPAYRNHFFDRNDLVDKASTIGRVEHGAVYCNFYRMGSSGPYSAGDRSRLERILPLVTSLIANHHLVLSARRGAAAPPPSLVHTLVGQAVPPFDRLTAREREVCSRIVLGYTSVGIGLDLAIAPSSVVTYRKRAYERLGIGSRHELFALCLAAAHRQRA